MSAEEIAFMRKWLLRSIATLETMPPTPSRNDSLRCLHNGLGRYPASNVVPLHGRR